MKIFNFKLNRNRSSDEQKMARELNFRVGRKGEKERMGVERPVQEMQPNANY